MEKEFSFVRFFKYAMRYILVVVLLVAIGLGIGAATAKRAKSTQYEKYSATISFDLEKYAKLSGLIGTDNSVILSNRAAQIVETIASNSVKTQTFDALKEELYPGVATEAEKQQLFDKDLVAQYYTDAVMVSFVYDMSAATEEGVEANRALAKKVISTYMEIAAKEVCDYNDFLVDALTFDQVFVVGRTQQSYTLPETAVESNAGVSLFSNAVAGGIIGALLAAVVLFLVYFFDPHIKSVEDILPEEKATVLLGEDADSTVRAIAHIKLANAKRIAITSPCVDGAYAAWVAKLVEDLKKSGATVNVVSFSKADVAWMGYFQNQNESNADYEVYTYNDDDTVIASYISTHADFSAFFVDQRKVMAKTLEKSVAAIGNDSYKCTILHNAGRTYVG